MMKKRPLHLLAIYPIYRLIRRYRPEWCRIPEGTAVDTYASAMLQKGNDLFRLIFPPFFQKIRFEIADENELIRASREGTLVYVARGIGQLEYNYFAHLFREVGLPRSMFVNDISCRRWMPWPELKATVIKQLKAIERHGGIYDPVSSGWLTELVASGKSALLSLNPSELEDDSVLLSRSQKLLSAVIAAQKKDARPVYIVPLDFVWNRRPSHAERSIVDILFGEKENPGRIRKIVLFWRNYNYRAVVKVGEPVDLTKFVTEAEEEKAEETARRLGKRIHTIIRLERRTVTGPLIRPKSWFVERVLVDDKFQQRICELAATLGKPADDVMHLARRYVKEIAADINYTYIELGAVVLRWVFRSLFSGLVFNQEGLSQAKRLYAKAPVVFVPNHKSHADYLILSYILYENNMTVPHVAAGLNLSFWPLGPFFRHCGAYFIRRSFENNLLYRTAVETYLRVLLEEGYSQEFFIEGGRSRTGKLMRPRYGMLKMLTETVGSGTVEDLHFIPVSLTYDKVPEERSYEEELAGAQKESEKASHLLRLVKYLKRQKGRYGKIYVTFGRSVSCKGKDVETIAQGICREINRNIVVTPQSLAAAALLSRPKAFPARDEVLKLTSLYLDWLKTKGAPLSQSLIADERSAIENAVDVLSSNREEAKRRKLDYLKNGSIHFFASIAVVATLLRKQERCDMEQLASDFTVCRDILKREFRFGTREPLGAHLKKITDFLDQKGISALEPFSALIRNYFESIKIAVTTVKRQTVEMVDEKELLKMMTATGKNMLLLGHISFEEAISRVNFSNALRLLCDTNILSEPSRRIYSSTKDIRAANNLQVQLERLT